MNITVAGVGYVGLAQAVLLAQHNAAAGFLQREFPALRHGLRWVTKDRKSDGDRSFFLHRRDL